jgi:PKD repeat protein
MSLLGWDDSMRLVGLLAVVIGTLMLASGCSDGAGTPPPDNAAPVANFEVPACVIDVPCEFASTSTDDAEVTRWSWDFNGDNTPDASTATASFEYTAAGTYTISLTVHDAEDLNHRKTSTITIDPPATVNTPPTAGFDHTCSDVDCTFTSTSSDEAPGSIATYAWAFGDGATSDESAPTHSYVIAAPTDFTVTLTVTDNEGATDIETRVITVVPPAPVNTPPTAGFTQVCDAANCRFTNTSTDVAPGTIVTHAWTFGDGTTSSATNPSHIYAVVAPTDFTVTLTVTDNEGATDLETATVHVVPPPPGAEGCTTTLGRVECILDIPVQSTVKLKLLQINCDIQGNRVTTPPPIGDQVFLNVCINGTVGQELGIFGGPTDSLIVFPAGSQVRIWLTQGTPKRGDPPLAPPAGILTGTFPEWTINWEDGDNAGGEGEPDFIDIVLGVRATERP